ncbi:MAG: hypothetical protein HOC23_23765 [Halieaceae bacterium]|jgi:hypothetical protein|nr:hypothetical protein [Halieaceae bacterium]
MLQKFVYWTGALDFVVGAATWGGALYDPQPGQFVALMTLGMFLMMAAACLVWASRDINNRYPVIFWQGLVRLTAVSAVIYGVPNGLSQQWEYSLVIFDGIIGLTYIVGSIKVTGLTFFDCLRCRAANVSGD